MTSELKVNKGEKTFEQGLDLYPWFKKFYQEFVDNGVPNSLLIYGEKDIGKLNFALYLANYLLCENKKNGNPCFECQACKWYSMANHPDFFPILPEDSYDLLPFKVNPETIVSNSSDDKKQSKYIRIDQVRDILSVNELSSYRGGMRVILIYPVEAMREEAANCLLKSLEEPGSNVFYILVSHCLESILPTIRSRCRLLALPKPAQDISIDWLIKQDQLSNQSKDHLEAQLLEMERSPLKVLKALEGKSFNSSQMLDELSNPNGIDHARCVDLLNQAQLSDLLVCLQKWCIDMYMVYSGLLPRYFPSREGVFHQRVKNLDINGLNQFLKILIQELKLSTHPLFPKVQLESVLSKYAQLFKS